MGRIVNFYDQTTTSKMPKAAKGCLKMIMKDDTGALTVSLIFLFNEMAFAHAYLHTGSTLVC